ncbi:MAG TPA: alanine--tRNA ligase [Actinomycetota bacterium]|nr:alanine--tRNA ligase [Actinomycetota bacterium]
MDSGTIRDRFLAFFGERAHERVPSSSLIPNDPTLLLTNAGMNQFKPYFLGEQQPPFARAMSVQKCFRATDIEEVGNTARHLTFFEMLGNFSFGDYYKQDACPWAWDLVTDGWGFDPSLLWVTVFETDDEAFDIWADGVGVKPDRIIRLGAKTNFWSMGVAGPCGPCSEIFVDLGDAYGDASDLGPGGNEDRYLEIWNLVFMQNDCNAAIQPIAELPKKNIDTGAGVERLAMVLQNVPSIYETDTLGSMIERAGALTKSNYGKDPRIDKGLRILADHGRSMTFLIADGVLPSNEARGYVLRRVMRRAVREARLLGTEQPVLATLAQGTIDLMGGFYPEIAERSEFILEVVAREEEHFSAALRGGLAVLEGEMTKARNEGRGIPGDVAFLLHDTYGFPIDLTTDIAGEEELDVDTAAFEELMLAQRERARAARKASAPAAPAEAAARLIEQHGTTEFVGYEHLSRTASIVGIADSDGAGLIVAEEGAEVDIILDTTPFYAEGGGQVGDTGSIMGSSGRGRVITTRRLAPGLTGHRLTVTAGALAVGDEVAAEVDAVHRVASERAHTATHILHWILRDRLGDHARQAGSLVEPGRLRFDFNHFDALGTQGVKDISDELQGRVLQDDGVRAYETSYDFARSIGAMAIFGEKYGDFVRVVEVGEYSKELCGGTHVPHTSQIGAVIVTSEGSVGSNLRRVEALVGAEGLAWLKARSAMLEETAVLLKASPDEVAQKVERLLVAQKEMERQLEAGRRDATRAAADDLVSGAERIGAARLVSARMDVSVDDLRSLAQTLKGQIGSGAIVLGASGEGRGNLVGAVTKDLVEAGVSARDILAPGAKVLGGGGGGKPDLAVSGGSAADKVDDAIEAAVFAARNALESVATS